MNFYEGKTGENYYNMRKSRRNEFVQNRRAGHFQPHIKEQDIVLDFGCGTGGVLSRIKCAKKIGIEVNELSLKEAQEHDIELHPNLSKVKDNSVDVIISNHALEHVTHPADYINELRRVLKKDGKAILVVPSESPFSRRFAKWQANDPDQHIFSWTPLSFGNLIHQCGFSIEKSFYRPIGYSKINQPLAAINEKLFQLSRHVIAFLLQRYEVVCIAKKS